MIGKTCKDADEATAAESIFGYTCVNDVTALQVLDVGPDLSRNGQGQKAMTRFARSAR